MSEKAEQKLVKSTPNASETEVHVQPQTSKHKLETPLQFNSNTSPLESLAKTVGEVGGTIADTDNGIIQIQNSSLPTPNSQLLTTNS
ncbi:MAG: hypothetical protein AAF915_02915 [Cyanobacteria bacterium P01_D01_bin.50]